ncbi:MAG: hypothetical protein L6Q83_02700 [Gammaproteobacteria bacterium]|nr:hypothetical protein [Gammaproteobacteria bacterium]
MKADWLVRPTTIRWLWIVFLSALAGTVAVQWLIPVKGHFGIDAGFGFHAWYGLLACAAMVIFARLLGWFLKRPDDYYGDER